MENYNEMEFIEIYVSCRNLPNMDTFSLTDAQISLYTQNQQKNWIFTGKTEIIWDSLNPNFVTTFKVQYFFEKQQYIKLEIVDVDDEKGKITNLIGSVEITLGQLFGSKKKTLILDIMNQDKKNGKIVLRCEIIKRCRKQIKLKLSAEKLVNPSYFSFFKGIKPFLRIFKYIDKQAYFIYETEALRGENVSFQQFKISYQKLCNSDDKTPIEIQVMGKHSNNQHDLIGSLTTNLQTIQDSQKLEFQKDNTSKGFLIIQYQEIDEPSMMEYVRGGLQFNLVTAVDFTGSNGDPDTPKSLHSFVNPQNNLYKQALIKVSEILVNYDNDQLIQMYGFGGKPRFQNLNSQQVMHCFPMTGDSENPSVYQVKGMVDLYDYCVRNILFSGPTLFSHILNQIYQSAQITKQQYPDEYLILFILTDGLINDLAQSKKIIVDLCLMPVSIIIVGVGNADFDAMDELDGDDGLYDDDGRKATRDLVQFVPFNKYHNDSERLCEEVLKEVPTQVTEYMMSIGKYPNQPIDHLQNDDIFNYIKKTTAI